MMSNLQNFFLFSILVFCAATDVRTNKIPNILTMPSAAFALVLHTLSNGMDGLLFSTVGMAVGIGLLVVPYLMNGMGAGDVKLMGLVGSFLGAKATIEAFILIAIAGGVYSMVLIFTRGAAFKGFFSEKLMILSSMVMLRQYVHIQPQTESSGEKPRLKYGVAIAFGTITYLLVKSFGIKFFA